MLQLLSYEHVYLLTVDTEFLKQKVHDVLCLRHHTGKQVCRLYGLLTIPLRDIDRLLYGLLRLDSEFV